MGLFKVPRSSWRFQKFLGVVTTLIVLNNPSVSFAEESAQINLRNVDIPTLIETVSRITGKSFVVDPRVKGKVTVITNSDIDADELYETFLSILQVHGFSAVPSGANLIKVVPSNQAKQQPVPVIGEEEENQKGKVKRSADELVTRVIRVEHVPAAMLVPILRPLVPSTGQLQAYGPSNTIVISDRAANIERLIKVIKRMDRADDEELEVVPLRYASAQDLAKTIQTLNKSNIKGAQSKNKISADVRTNSLLLSGDKSSRQQVRKIIAKLDTPQPLEERTKVIYLHYAKAVDLAKVLTGFSKTQKSKKATKKGAAGTQKADVDIQADEATNSLIITAEPDVQKNLAKVIRRLDVRRAQVLVEAIIADVSSSLSKKIGLQLASGATGGSKSFGGGIVSSYASAGSSLVGVLSGNVTSVADGLTAALGVGKDGVIHFGLLLNALSGDSATNILSTPSLVAMDNEEAKIVVATNVAVESGQFSNTGTDGGSSSPSNPFITQEQVDVGLTLKIKPQINDGTSIRLEISQETSNLAASDAGPGNRAIDKRTIDTSVIVEDGQVLVLGGLIQDTFTDTEQKVPFLGDIPIIGKAFRNKSTQKSKKNLMVFIHPVIMRDVLSGDSYTRQKYSSLKRAQTTSKSTARGLLGKGATPFPTDIRRNVVEHLTAAQKKQIIIREQQQRVLAHQNKIRQAKMDQQQRATAKQAQRNGVVAKPIVTARQTQKLPQRLRNIVPQKRKVPQQRQPSDNLLNGIEY